MLLVLALMEGATVLAQCVPDQMVPLVEVLEMLFQSKSSSIVIARYTHRIPTTFCCVLLKTEVLVLNRNDQVMRLWPAFARRMSLSDADAQCVLDIYIYMFFNSLASGLHGRNVSFVPK